MAKIVWQYKVTSDMVKGWSTDKIDELTDELDDAVERIFSDMEDEAMMDEEEEDEEEKDEEEDED